MRSLQSSLSPDFVKGVIANKIDRYKDKQVRIDVGENFAKSKNARFLEFSAKDEGPEKLEKFLTELLEEYLQKENEAKNKNEIKLDEPKKKKKNNCAK